MAEMRKTRVVKSRNNFAFCSAKVLPMETLTGIYSKKG